MMYSFGQRSDTKVFDEPLYAHYLLKSGVDHPGREEVLATMEQDGQKVVDEIILGDHGKHVLFFKLMTHFLVEIDRTFLQKVRNVLLIREPAEIIASYSKVIPEVRMDDIGVEMQYTLYHELVNSKQDIVVLDAKEILKDPAKILSRLCTRLGIPFDPAMLSWPAGPRPEDGVWAKYWYHSLHASTGFQAYRKREIRLSGKLADLASECEPYYSFLYEQSIRA
jgi:hypothetical protein